MKLGHPDKITPTYLADAPDRWEIVAADYRNTLAATLEALSGLSPTELDEVLGNTARACYRPRGAARR
jgi:hypothetical protein